MLVWPELIKSVFGFNGIGNASKLSQARAFGYEQTRNQGMRL